jgi:hypothetical protein
MTVYEFEADWYAAEDAETRLYPHDIIGWVEAVDLEAALALAEETYAEDGQVVEVRSAWRQGVRRYS